MIGEGHSSNTVHDTVSMHTRHGNRLQELPPASPGLCLARLKNRLFGFLDFDLFACFCLRIFCAGKIAFCVVDLMFAAA